MRAVLAALSFGEPRTAPDLARERAVSRQHVQSVINELLSAGLIERLSNPAHRRSPRFTPTEEGRRRLQMISEREARCLTRIAPAVSHLELAAATRLLDYLERDLAAQIAGGDPA